jgi:aryl-alcohol dehydrogenase-like predicted oxidoreductase
MTMAQWAIGWCLRHPAVSCVVVGAKSDQQLESNAATANFDIVRDDRPGQHRRGGDRSHGRPREKRLVLVGDGT